VLFRPQPLTGLRDTAQPLQSGKCAARQEVPRLVLDASEDSIMPTPKFEAGETFFKSRHNASEGTTFHAFHAHQLIGIS
jgi:hypothetical protein